MINNYILDEALSLPVTSENEISLFNTLEVAQRFVQVHLNMNEKYEPYYSINVDDLLKSNMAIDDLIKLRYGGWEYNEDKKLLIKKIKTL